MHPFPDLIVWFPLMGLSQSDGANVNTAYFTPGHRQHPLPLTQTHPKRLC